MSIKKVIKYAVVILFSSIVFAYNVLAVTGVDLINQINQEIKDFYKVPTDYYNNIASINQYELDRRVQEYEKYGFMLNPITYGTNSTTYIGHNHWNYWTPSIGTNKFGAQSIAAFLNCDINQPNPEFVKMGSGWLGNKLSYDGYLVKFNEIGRITNKLYTNSSREAKIQAVMASQVYSREGNIQSLPYEEACMKLAMLEDSVQTGMDVIWAGKTGKDVTQNYNQRNMVVYEAGVAPAGGWMNWVLVVVPPTSISWGEAWRFNFDNIGSVLITEIPMAPFNMTDIFDLSVSNLSYAESANAGDVVTFIAEARSNIEDVKEGVSYKWTITDGAGNPVGASYGGHGYSASGTFSADKYYTKQFSATFTMPSSNVKVRFEINGDKKHSEKNYDNNAFAQTVRILQPAPPLTEGEVVLDYDIYSRDHESRLAPMTAHFAARAYEGNGEAGISSWTNNSSVLSNYNYENHFTVNSAPFTINPWYKGKLLRSGFGDNPEAKVYKANGVYPITVTQMATGQAWRRFWTAMGVDKEGNVIYGLATEWHNFPTATTHLPVRALVYNGGSVGKPYTKNEVSGANISWTSNPVSFNVYRKMYHMDLGGNRVGEKSVPGQFTRSFTAQNTASVVWSAPMTLAQGYARDRQTASNRGSNYTNAIFATDKQFARVAYPFKSGYMFNPVGTYQCVVKSTVYYDISASEAEKKSAHEELVNKVINSFVYDNNLQYTTNGKDVYDYKNVTSANRKGILNVTRNDSANITAIPHSQYQTCMEGYSESGTLQSFNNYKYREFVSKDRVSRIDAQTVITFTVGSSAKRYTYINMRDGQYPITVRSMPFSFKGLTAPGIHLSDGITVTVKGSLYDDRG